MHVASFIELVNVANFDVVRVTSALCKFTIKHFLVQIIIICRLSKLHVIIRPDANVKIISSLFF